MPPISHEPTRAQQNQNGGRRSADVLQHHLLNHRPANTQSHADGGCRRRRHDQRSLVGAGQCVIAIHRHVQAKQCEQHQEGNQRKPERTLLIRG